MYEEMKKIHPLWGISAVILIAAGIWLVIAHFDYAAGFCFFAALVGFLTGWETRNDRMRW